MNPKLSRKTLGLGLASLLAANVGLATASADSLMLDFGQTTVAAPYLTLSPGHATGAIPMSDTSWNIITSSSPSSSLVYGSGASATGLTLTLGQEASAGSSVISFSTSIANVNLAGTGGSVAGQKNLLGTGSIYGDDTSSTAAGRDGFFGAAGSAIGLRLDGLAAGDYLFYVMARNVNSDAASIPMNIYAAAGASAGTFDFSSVTGSQQSNVGYPSLNYAGQYNTFVNGENYVGLSLTVGAGQSVFFAVDGQPTGELRGFLNSVQIASVPEPGTAAMFAMGMGILLRLWHKRPTA